MTKFDAFTYMRSVRDDASLSSTQKHVALVMVTWANNRTGEAHPEHGTVAEATGYNVQTVRRTLAALVKCGRLASDRTARPGGGTLIHYTLRVRPTDAVGTTAEQGSSGSDDTNGSGKPVVPSIPVEDDASGALDTSDALGTSDALDTEPLVSRASLLGNYPRTTSRKHPQTVYTRGSNGADDGQQELAALEAEAQRVDIDSTEGSPDARLIRAIDWLAAQKTDVAKNVGNRDAYRRSIVEDLRSEHYVKMLGYARQGWTARDLAARIENPAHRPRPRAVGGDAA